MECFYRLIFLGRDSDIAVNLIYVYSIAVAVMNISANGFLIYALHRTGQTGTISLELIQIMSTSDTIIGINSLMATMIIGYGRVSNQCLAFYVAQLITTVFGTFSTLLIIVIALDRYLHMKYLERYPIIFTKKRGRYLVVGAILIAVGLSPLVMLPKRQSAFALLRTAFFIVVILMCVSIVMLHNYACRALQTRMNQLTRSIITQNRALGRTSNRIALCAVILITPFTIIIGAFEHVAQLKAVNVKALKICLWFAFTTFQCNGFSNSIIFVAHNRPVRLLLKRLSRHCHHCQSSVSGTGEK